MDSLNKYQEIDGNIVKIETEIKKSDERKKLLKVKIFLDEVDAMIAKMEQRAGELVGSFRGCERRLQELSQELKEYEDVTFEEGTSESEVNFIQSKAEKLQSQIRGAEKDGETIASEIAKLTEEFESFKEKISTAKKEYAKNKEVFDGFRDKFRPEVDALKKQMKELEGDIDSDLLEGYKKARKEKVFPVYVNLVGENCGGCGMQLALSIISKLDTDKYIRCEHCGKLVRK